MAKKKLQSIMLSNGATITRGTEIAAVESFEMGSALFSAGEIYEVTSVEMESSQQTVMIGFEGMPVDIFDLGALELRIESRELAIVETQ